MSEKNRKFTIKSSRYHMPLDESGAEKPWQLIAHAIDEIHKRNASSLSFEEVHRNAYKLVLHRHGGMLYNNVSNKLNEQLLQQMAVLKQTPREMLISEVKRVWEHHRQSMVMVRDILMYMDRTYVKSNHSIKPVYELGIHKIQTLIWDFEDTGKVVIDLILEEILSERSSKVDVDALEKDVQIKSILCMLQEFHEVNQSQSYERAFETRFLATTKEFYRAESDETVSSKGNVSNYIDIANKRLAEEKDRVARYHLPSSTEQILLHILETQWISVPAQQILVWLPPFFRSNDLALLKSLYDLWARIKYNGVLHHLWKVMSDVLMNELEAMAASSNTNAGTSSPSVLTCSKFVEGVWQIRERYVTMVDEAFGAEKKAHKTLKETLEKFLNRDSRAASLLAAYCDEIQRNAKLDASEVKEILDRVIVIFRYLQDKDVFECYYKQHLGKRLLSNKSASDSTERHFVGLLKAECGYQYTSKLEGMFNDMRLSTGTREAYRTYKERDRGSSGANKHGGNSIVDLEVDVLTAGYWPMNSAAATNAPNNSDDTVILPDIIKASQDNFLEYYLKAHSGRKLQLQINYGQVGIRSNFVDDKGNTFTATLSVTTYQMCILMLFKDREALTLKEIREATNIPENELLRNLISLTTPRHRILKKGSRGMAIAGDSDTFTFNGNFKAKLKKVKVPLVSMKDVVNLQSKDKSSSGTGGSVGGLAPGGSSALLSGSSAIEQVPAAPPVSVEEDRRHLVEASIVRIMKARKTLDHNNLVAEVTRQLSIRFVPTPNFIKQRVESLIERDYLERDDQDRRIYNYVA